MSLRGRCLCGDVVWDADGPAGAMWHCHCRACRKASGAGFATWLEVATDALRLDGWERVATYASSTRRRRCFCSRCGSVLPWRTEDESRTWLPAGALESDPGVRPTRHAHPEARAPWQPLPDVKDVDAPAGPAECVGGSCLCGDVRYEIADPEPAIWHCHCSRDRRVTGAACDACVGAAPDAVRWLAGRDRVVVWKLPEARVFRSCFCARCGGLVPNPDPPSGTERLCIPAGALDDDPGARPRFHIFWGSRVAWSEATDSLARFEAYPE